MILLARRAKITGLLGLLVALATGSCATDEPKMPRTCTTTDTAGYERALHAAPRAVRLAGDVRISDCLRRARGDAELQELGLIVHAVAEHLAARARGDGDPEAAVALGYLGGAAAVGAERSNGISAELARRVGTTASGLEDAGPAVSSALRRGRDAGTATG